MSPLPQKLQFHWVNNSTQLHSFSDTDGNDRTAIRRFVQHRQLANRRLGELQVRFPKHLNGSSRPDSMQLSSRKVKRYKAALDNDQTSSSTSPETTPRHSNPLVKNAKGPSQLPSILRWQTSNIRKAARTISKTSKFAKMQSQWLLAPNKFLESPSIEPFASSAQPLTAEAITILRYYSATILTGGSPYKLQYLPIKLRNNTPIQAVRDQEISNAMQYEHCLYALFAFASSRLLHVTKLHLDGVKDHVYYMARSVTLLRQSLAKSQQSGTPVETATIGAIVQMALADWTSGDLSAARIHLKSLSMLLKFIDFESPTGRFMIETIRTADFQVALEGNTRPLLNAVPSFEPLSRTRIIELEAQVQAAINHDSNPRNDIAGRLGCDYPLPDDILADLRITLDLRLGWALKESLETHIFAPSFHPIIRNILNCTTIAKAVWILETATRKDTGYLCRWSRTNGHLLYTYGFDHADDERTRQSLLTNCVRLGLLIGLTLCTNRMGTRAAKTIGLELFEAAQRIDGQEDMPRLAKCSYLWVLVIGAMVVSNDAKVRNWFLNQAADTAMRLNLSNYEEVDQAMTGFLYSWTFFLPTVMEVLEIIEGNGRGRGTERRLGGWEARFAGSVSD